MQTGIGDLRCMSDSNHEQLMSQARFTQQVIEQKERELHKSILQNYQRIRDVEKELAELQLQVKLTAEPKRAAMEVLRKKIEIQGNRVAAVRKRHTAAKQAFEEVETELDHEEAMKQQLCNELNQLVSTSVSSQLERFEQLRSKLESLQGGGVIGPTRSAPDNSAAAAIAADCSTLNEQEMASGIQVKHHVELAADGTAVSTADAAGERHGIREAASAAARSKHVQLHQARRGGSADDGALNGRATWLAGQQQRCEEDGRPVHANGRFAGFDA